MRANGLPRFTLPCGREERCSDGDGASHESGLFTSFRKLL